MDYQLNPDQSALVDGVNQVLKRAAEAPKDGAFHNYDAALDGTMREAGFLDVAADAEFGPLGAALVVEAVAKSPAVIECAASALVAPQVLGATLEGPVALVSDARRSARFLGVARHAIVLDGDVARVVSLDGVARVAAAESLFAYPMARFANPEDARRGDALTADQTEKLKQWWRVAIATEAAGAMQAAVEFTVDYVRTRRQFNRALGSFQAIQHRLAERTVQAQATRWLALEAAWKGDPAAAAVAATYAQRAIPSVVHDCHQFNGALGVTLEHTLHYWTYRLTALQGELGGLARQSTAAASLLWR